jgi:AcrR family transcriptional regulator
MAFMPEPTPAPQPTSAAARSRIETRRRLIAAGTELFARHGLLRTTTTQIARAAGVAAGTFYLHFPDKHALFRDIAFAALGALQSDLNAAHAAAGPDPIAQLRARMATIVAFAEAKRELMQIVFGRGHEAGEIGAELADALFPGVESRVREGIEVGRLDPGLHAAVTAQALVATWIRVVAWWSEDPSRAPREAVVETLVRLHPTYTHREARTSPIAPT